MNNAVVVEIASQIDTFRQELRDFYEANIKKHEETQDLVRSLREELKELILHSSKKELTKEDVDDVTPSNLEPTKLGGSSKYPSTTLVTGVCPSKRLSGITVPAEDLDLEKIES